MNTSKIEITGTQLKLIAIITMFIDHIGAGILENRDILMKAITAGVDLEYYLNCDKILRGIGRMAFPIYCFLLVEGFFHTKSKVKYALRLLFIAVISEIPFDMLFRDDIFYINYNNVLWELLLGLVVLCGLDYVNRREFSCNETIIVPLLMVIIVCAGMAVGYFLHFDYGWAGICCISVMYKLYGYTNLDRVRAFGIGVLVLALYKHIEASAFLMLIPVFYYKGSRGRDSQAIRAFCYLFYPVHILILYLIRVAIT